MKLNQNNSLKSFFIKLIAITFSIIIIINVVFNVFFSSAIEKINQIFYITEKNNRVVIKEKIRSEIEKGLKKEEMINKEDKILILKVYKKLQKELKILDK
ncbi:hypothetical protein OAS47_04915 [Pelagibacteraceae bacterium]|nr:hypothetical protein [Pelagibacteraceae bacterium]